MPVLADKFLIRTHETEKYRPRIESLLSFPHQAMSDEVGRKALSGEWAWISNKCIEIKKKILMGFKGRPCNIINNKSDPIPADELGLNNRLVERDVLPGYRYYMMRAHVKFGKKAFITSQVNSCFSTLCTKITISICLGTLGLQGHQGLRY